MKSIALSLGFYPGILLGFRSYMSDDRAQNHVLYLPFIDICLTIEELEEEE